MSFFITERKCQGSAILTYEGLLKIPSYRQDYPHLSCKMDSQRAHSTVAFYLPANWRGKVGWMMIFFGRCEVNWVRISAGWYHTSIGEFCEQGAWNVRRTGQQTSDKGAQVHYLSRMRLVPGVIRHRTCIPRRKPSMPSKEPAALATGHCFWQRFLFWRMYPHPKVYGGSPDNCLCCGAHQWYGHYFQLCQ